MYLKYNILNKSFQKIDDINYLILESLTDWYFEEAYAQLHYGSHEKVS